MGASLATVRVVALPTEGLIPLRTVLAVLRVSKTAWYRGIQRGRFPAPVYLGRSARWDAAAVRAVRAQRDRAPSEAGD